MEGNNKKVEGNIYDIQRFAVHDGPGIRTNVFLKGCPMRCLWCHSPESQSFEFETDYSKNKIIGKTVSVDECMRIIRKDMKYYKQSNGGVTISGGEPMSQFVFCKSLTEVCKEEGYHVALDTSGYAPTENYIDISPFIDLFLYDLKCMNSVKHLEFTGIANELILQNAIRLAEVGSKFQFRIPVIPGYNVSTENTTEIAQFICGIKDNGGIVELVQLLPYHSLGENKYKKIGRTYTINVSSPADDLMEEQLMFFRSFGLNVKIG